MVERLRAGVYGARVFGHTVPMSCHLYAASRALWLFKHRHLANLRTVDRFRRSTSSTCKAGGTHVGLQQAHSLLMQEARNAAEALENMQPTPHDSSGAIPQRKENARVSNGLSLLCYVTVLQCSSITAHLFALRPYKHTTTCDVTRPPCVC